MSDTRQAINILIKALELCNESRNRLTRFEATPDFWLKEAQADMIRAADSETGKEGEN